MESFLQSYIKSMATPNPSAMVTVNDPVYGTIKFEPPSISMPEATKHDQGKPDWTLVPFEALEDMVRVLEFGAKKYARNNWAENGGFSYRRVISAALRHLFAFLRGEDTDPESGISHIAHAQCNLLFLAHYIRNKANFTKDDRDHR
jgi:hypothetical protein